MNNHHIAETGNRERKMNTDICGRIIDSFRTQIIRAWLHAMRRRSHKARNLTWARFRRLVKTWIPTAKATHPYPFERLHVTTFNADKIQAPVSLNPSQETLKSFINPGKGVPLGLDG